MDTITIKKADFESNSAEIKRIRTSVFIQEQNVPIELEWDGLDKDAIHILAYYDNEVVATARMLKDGQIGRMAVLKPFRRRTIGKKMLNYLLRLAEKNSIGNIFLSAQTHALEFYKKNGFTETGSEYMDAGIPHYKMIRIDSKVR